MLGTIHDKQFESQAYPYWQLRSVIESIQPNLLLVEIRPESIQANKWGEGPPEMPLVISWARELNLNVQGMDYWKPDEISIADFSHREDQMLKNILANTKGSKVTVIFTGFSHVAGMKRRLLGAGYKIDETFNASEKDKIFQYSPNHSIPASYFEAVSAAARDASESRSDYSKDWSIRRLKLLASLRLQAPATH